MVQQDGEINRGSLETKPIVIDIRRWDPFTAISSASLSTMSGMADATAGIILDPYREYKHHRSISNPEDTPTTDPQTGNPNHTRQMLLLSVTSLGKFLGRASRGALLDLPLAATEGMRSLPRLDGDPLRNQNPITSFETGAAVAWSTFTHGIYEGVTYICTYVPFEERAGCARRCEGVDEGAC